MRSGARERGTVLKKWTNRAPVCVVFPNTYYVRHVEPGCPPALPYDSTSGPTWSARGSFSMDRDGRSRSRAGVPSGAFEIVFFTLSFEMDYPNVVAMLRESAIPVLAAERGEHAPIVVGGGICAMANPEPLSRFFDLFILGDVESCVPPFIERYLQGQRQGKERGHRRAFRSSLGLQPLPPRRRLSGRRHRWGVQPARFSRRRRAVPGKSPGRIRHSQRATPNSPTCCSWRGAEGALRPALSASAGNIYPFISDRLDEIGGDVKDVGIIGGGVSFHPQLGEIVERLSRSGLQGPSPVAAARRGPLAVIEALQGRSKRSPSASRRAPKVCGGA